MGRILAKYSLFILLSLSYSSYAHGQTPAPSTYAPDEVIVKMKGDRRGGQVETFVSKAQSQKGLNLKNSWSRMGMYHFGLKPGQKLNDAMAELRQDPDVEYVEPNYYLNKLDVGGFSDIVTKDEMVNMSSGSYQATSAPIQVTDSWALITGTSVPIVAIIDTGVDTGHSVFTASNAIWQNPGENGTDGNGNNKRTNGVDDDGNGYIDDYNGWNFVSNSNNVFDNNGHGTHVAGITLGVGLNIYASTPGQSPIKIMPLKFLNGAGSGKTSDAIKAIYYAVNNGASVMNNSWGGYSYSAALHEAVTYSYDAGVAFIAAAGNETNDNDAVAIYPAGYDVPNVISVAATTDADNLASFSNYGRNTVGLASPGYRIYSTYPGNSFGISSGTSMASPFVAGLAAILVKQQPTILGYQVKEIIMSNTDAVTGLATKVQTQGRMNAYDSIMAANSASIMSSQPSYTFTNYDRAPAAAGGCGTVSTLMKGGGSGLG
ncbi:MAG: S8 family peptidase, partial [Bdellovibrionota bacterium]